MAELPMVIKGAFAYFSKMPFLPVTPAFFADLHDASVECFVFESARSRLLLTLLLNSDRRLSHRRQQVVFSGISTGAEVERVNRLVTAALFTGGRTKLGYRLNEFCLLPPAGEDEYPQGRLEVRLAIDHLPPLQLRCEKITSQEENFA